LLTPDEAIEQAKRLENDEARRQLANNLRLEARELEFDERDERLRLADQIEAMCTTSDAPAIQQTPLAARPRTVEERYARYGADIMQDVCELHEELILPLVESLTTKKGKERLLSILATVYAEFSGEARSGKRDYRAAKIITELNEWAETPLEREALASHLEVLLDNLTPIKRGVDPDRISARSRAIGNRGHDDGAVPSDGGGVRPHIARRRTALDRKATFGQDTQLNHIRPAKRSRAAAWAGVRRIDPVTGKVLGAMEGKPPKVQMMSLREPKPRPDDAWQDKLRAAHGGARWKSAQRSDKDWEKIGSADDGSLPDEKLATVPVSEKNLYGATKDHPKPALTVKEIARQAEEARAAAEEKAANEGCANTDGPILRGRGFAKHRDDDI
jgi:hypothetical protein